VKNTELAGLSCQVPPRIQIWWWAVPSGPPSGCAVWAVRARFVRAWLGSARDNPPVSSLVEETLQILRESALNHREGASSGTGVLPKQR
jgi:hypothetical protein